MEPQSKTKSSHYSQEQKQMLIDLVSHHPKLNSGKFTGDFTQKHAQNIWENISQTLNAIPGARKDWRKWRKAWQDVKTSIKAKRASIVREHNQTGGGTPPKECLSSTDQKVLDAICPTAITGLTNTQESTVEFTFEDAPSDCIIEEIVSIPTSINEEQKENVDQPSSSMGINIHDYAKKDTIQTKGLKRTVASRRLLASATATRDLADLGKTKLQIKEEYYKKKIALMERQVLAIERIGEHFCKQ